jgi:NTP pyrophosphatase (non-canonical NTP hydrolase)
MSDAEIYEKAIAKWGVPAQIRMAIEECAELIVALTKWGRKVNGTTHEHVCEEIADVEIMIKQVKIVLKNMGVDAESKIAMYREAKISRLKCMLEDIK